MSPTIHAESGFRFYFWPNEGQEPPHIHVSKAEARAKWWLDPLSEAWSYDFSPSQRRIIRRILERSQRQFLWRWYVAFEQGQG